MPKFNANGAHVGRLRWSTSRTPTDHADRRERAHTVGAVPTVITFDLIRGVLHPESVRHCANVRPKD
jgi:hypothetical protein